MSESVRERKREREGERDRKARNLIQTRRNLNCPKVGEKDSTALLQIIT